MKAYQITFRTENVHYYNGEETVIALANTFAAVHDKAIEKLKVVRLGRTRKRIKAIVEIGEAL